jgi:hypothetical protein
VPEPDRRGDEEDVGLHHLLAHLGPLVAVAHVQFHSGPDIEVRHPHHLALHTQVTKFRHHLLREQLAAGRRG